MRNLEPFTLNQQLLSIEYRKATESQYPEYYHCHQPGEWFLFHSGEGQVVVNGRIYDLRPGLLFYFQPYQVHKIHAETASGHPFVRSIVHFDPHILERCLAPFPGLQAFYRHIWQRELQEHVFDAADRLGDLEGLYRQHTRARSHTGFADREELDAIFAAQILVVLRELYGSRLNGLAHTRPRPKRYAEAVMEWLETRFTLEFRLEELAQDLHLSKAYVSRVFRRETGGSITEYISARRMREACILLSSTSRSIETIALQVGFGNLPYFSQAFKAMYGVTPSQYRKSPGSAPKP